MKEESPPGTFSDLWRDVDDAIEYLEDWLQAGASEKCGVEFWRKHAAQTAVLTTTERICLWGRARPVKYMGSKRVMFENGLGDILAEEANEASRVVDLFCGSTAVSWFAATQLGKPVLSSDLQEFATALAGAVVKRTVPGAAAER